MNEKNLTSDVLLIERIGSIAIITLNRPQSHNAYNGEMVQRFDSVFDDIENDESINCVIVTGAGERSFCAGADLHEAQQGRGETLLSNVGGYQPLQYRKRKKIWIAAVNGFALGGGFELAMHCDFIIASEKVIFGLPEVQHGLLPLGGGLEKLPELLPMPLVREIVLAGKRLSADEALQYGIINQIADKKSAFETALTFAQQLAERSSPALFAAHDLLNALNTLDGDEWQQLSKHYLHDVATKREEGDI